MNKLRKILVLMLILTVLVTSFSVVAFATDGGEEEVPEKKMGVLSLDTFEGAEEGSLEFQANDDGKGYFGVAIAENGNRYIKHYNKAGTGNEGYLSGPYMANKKYSFTEYPYFAMDIDVSKLTDEYAGFNLQGYIYAYGPVYDDLGNQTATLNGTSAGNVSLNYSAIQKYLPTEKNEWAHVTVIFKYHVYDGGEYLGAYAYVNGKLVYSDPKSAAVSETYLASNYYFGTFRVTPSGSGTTNYSAYDNWQMSFFNDAYTMDEIATYFYNDSYELPYGTTKAMIGYTVYDNLSKAINAAKAGDTIMLLSDINGVVSVEKSVKIDTNKYDEDGNPTGEYYNLQTTSTTLVSSSENGILNFRQLQNASVEVYWDDCPGVTAGGECTCDPIYLDEEGNHRMALFTPSAMLNSVPFYTGEVPIFPTENGLSTQFVGWSYTPGGEPEPLRAVTEEDIANGWISLYPVYESLQYGIEVISSAGSSFYLAEDYESAFGSAPAGSTVKLHTDVLTTATITLVQKSFTLDLNGHSFGLVKSTVTDYSATYDEETGEYVKGSKIADPVDVGAAGYIFKTAKNGYTFTITSSRPGGVLASFAASYDRWICDGVPVKTDNAALTSVGSLFSLYPSSATFNIISQKGYISIYTGNLFYGEHGACGPALRTTIDGANIYILGSHGDGGNAIRGGGEHYFKNCNIVGSGGNIHKGGGSSRNRDSNFYYEDCNVSNGVIYSGATTDTFTFTRCNLNVKFSGSYELIFNAGTYSVNDPTAYKNYLPAEGIEILSLSEEFSYNQVSGPELVFNPVTYLPVATPLTNEVSGEYKYYSYNPNLGTTNVKWMYNGELIAETTAVKNMATAGPAVDSGDGWRAVSNLIWKDANGNVSNLVLGEEDEYIFYGELPPVEEREYVGCMTGAMFNMSYMAHFRYNLYIPVEEGVTIDSVSGLRAQSTHVFISNTEYYCYYEYASTTEGANSKYVVVTYTIDGQQYTANFTISALVYATISVQSPAHTALDKEAAGCLVRYIEESCKAAAEKTGTPMSDNVVAKFADFYKLYKPADYVTEYPENEIKDFNEAAVDGLIHSVSYSLYNNNTVGLVVTLTDEAVAAGYKVTFGGIMWGGNKTSDGKVWYTKDVALHDRVMGTNTTITVTDADGVVVKRDLDLDGDGQTESVSATTAYSVATYCKATENDLGRALYAFGKAVQAVRANIYN